MVLSAKLYSGSIMPKINPIAKMRGYAVQYAVDMHRQKLLEVMEKAGSELTKMLGVPENMNVSQVRKVLNCAFDQIEKLNSGNYRKSQFQASNQATNMLDDSVKAPQNYDKSSEGLDNNIELFKFQQNCVYFPILNNVSDDLVRCKKQCKKLMRETNIREIQVILDITIAKDKIITSLSNTEDQDSLDDLEIQLEYLHQSVESSNKFQIDDLTRLFEDLNISFNKEIDFD